MAKKAERVSGTVSIERTVWVPGWGYNFLVARATAKNRPWSNVSVKAELSRLLEHALREEMKAEGVEPGNSPEMDEAA